MICSEKTDGREPMARGDQLGRQWRIIQTLLTSKLGKSAADLAEEMEANPRTVYRDLEALQVAGFPIYTERVDGKNLWSLLDTMKHHIPIPFNLMELMALYFSRDMMKVFKDTVFYDNLESLFNKIKTTLPKESLNFLDRTEHVLSLGIKPYKEYGRFKEIINRVNEAAVNRRSVEIVYFTMSRKKETKRKVDPYRIWFFDGTFYLIGFCHFREEVRIFALDRIKMLHQTKDPFEMQPEFDFDEFLKTSFGVFQGEPTQVKIRFSPEVAGYIKEKIWHDSQKLEYQEDGSLLFEAVVAGTQEIKYWILGWGSHAEVLEPESLKEEICAQAVATLNLYQNVTTVREAKPPLFYGEARTKL
jgi:predicted DNA-binding transcriptional regulator YafY